MAWSTIRPALSEDRAALEESAARFCARHSIPRIMEYREDDIYAHTAQCHTAEQGYLFRLWRRCAARALGHAQAEGIAYGYVGFTVE